MASLSADHVNVCIRIRPLLRDELFRGNQNLAWNWEQNCIYQSPHLQSKKLGVKDDRILGPRYNFDQIFRPEHTNEFIFETAVKKLIRRTLDGFHGSVFTYGQTASGKTFTMSGNSFSPGIIPMAINHCFSLIQEYPLREFLFRVSYLEVYNEQVKDLLSTEPTQIKIQHGAKVGTVLTGVKEQIVLTPEQVMALLAAGEAQRHFGSTDMNEKSSRAHTLFKLIIESKLRSKPSRTASSTEGVTVSYLCMADLAGSENAKMTQSVGLRAKEAKYINQSLLTLSTIIQKLSEDRGPSNASPLRTQPHLPYRDSKLTRLMQSSLSGEANIVIICTVSPTIHCFEETHNTLKFAARAKRVRVDARLNEVVDDKTLLRAYRMEIEQLKAKLRVMEQQTATATAAPTANAPNSRPRGVSEDDSDGEDMDYVLQMIAEMERMILKADEGTPHSVGEITPRQAADNSSDAVVASASQSSPSSPRGKSPKANASSSPSSPKGPRPKSDLFSTASRLSAQSYSHTNTRDNSLSMSESKHSDDPPADQDYLQTRSSDDSERFVRRSTEDSQIQPSPSLQSDSHDQTTAQTLLEMSDADAIDATSGHHLRPSLAIDSLAADSSDGPSGEQVLSNVRNMLSLLKAHVAKSAVRRTPGSAATTRARPAHRRSFADASDYASAGVDLADRLLDESEPSLHAAPGVLQRDSLAPPPATTNALSAHAHSQLTFDLKLKEADNRFLQDEVERKDQMLSMLSDGLREVESSHQIWLREKVELTSNLSRIVHENEMLLAEVSRLQDLLDAREELLFKYTGVCPATEEY